jgi:hypothetical protein
MVFLPVSLSNGEQIQGGAGSFLTTGIQSVCALGKEKSTWTYGPQGTGMCASGEQRLVLVPGHWSSSFYGVKLDSMVVAQNREINTSNY